MPKGMNTGPKRWNPQTSQWDDVSSTEKMNYWEAKANNESEAIQKPDIPASLAQETTRQRIGVPPAAETPAPPKAPRQRGPNPMRQADETWLKTLQGNLGTGYIAQWTSPKLVGKQVEIVNPNFVAEPLTFNVNLQHNVSKVGTVPIINENLTPGGVNAPAGVPIRAGVQVSVHDAIKANPEKGTQAKPESIDVVGFTPTTRLSHLVKNAFENANKQEDLPIRKAFQQAVAGVRQEEYEENATRANKQSPQAAINKHLAEVTVNVAGGPFDTKRGQYALAEVLGGTRAPGVQEPTAFTPVEQGTQAPEQKQFFQALREQGVVFNQRGNLQTPGNVITRTNENATPVARLTDAMKSIFNKSYGIGGLSTRMRPVTFEEDTQGRNVPRFVEPAPNTQQALLAGDQPQVTTSNIVQPAGDKFPVTLETIAMPRDISGILPGGALKSVNPQRQEYDYGHGTKLGMPLPEMNARDILEGKVKFNLQDFQGVGNQLGAGSRNLSLGTMSYKGSEIDLQTSKGEEALFPSSSPYLQIPSHYNPTTMEFTQGGAEEDVSTSGLIKKLQRQTGLKVRRSNLPGTALVMPAIGVGLARSRGGGGKFTENPITSMNVFQDTSRGTQQAVDIISSEGAKAPDVAQHLMGALTNPQQSALFNLWAENLPARERKAARVAVSNVEQQLARSSQQRAVPLDLNQAAAAYQEANPAFVGGGRELAAQIYQQQFVNYAQDPKMQARNLAATGSQYTLDPLKLGRFSPESMGLMRENYIRANTQPGRDMTAEQAGQAFDVRYRPAAEGLQAGEYPEVTYHPQPGEEYFRGRVERTRINAAETYSNEMGMAVSSAINTAYPEVGRQTGIDTENARPAQGAEAAGSFLNYLVNQRAVAAGGAAPENVRQISTDEAQRIRDIPKEVSGKAYNETIAKMLGVEERDQRTLLQFQGEGQPLIPNPNAMNQRGVFENLEGTSIGKVGLQAETLMREAAIATQTKGLALNPESRVQKASTRLFGTLDDLSANMIDRTRRIQSDWAIRAEATVNPMLNPGEFTMSKPYMREIASRISRQSGRSVETEYKSLSQRKDLGGIIARDPLISESESSLIPAKYVSESEMVKRFGSDTEAAALYKKQNAQNLTMGISADMPMQVLGDVDGDKYIAFLNLKYGNKGRVQTYAYPQEMLTTTEKAKARELAKAGGNVQTANQFNANVQGFEGVDPLAKGLGKISSTDRPYQEVVEESLRMADKGTTVGPTYGVATAMQAANIVQRGTSETNTDIELAYEEAIDIRGLGKSRMASAISSVNFGKDVQGTGYLGYSTEDPVDERDIRGTGPRRTNRMYLGGKSVEKDVNLYGVQSFMRQAARDIASPTKSGNYLTTAATMANMFGRDKEDTAELQKILETTPEPQRGNVLEARIDQFYNEGEGTRREKDYAMFQTQFGLQQAGTALVKDRADEGVANQLAEYLSGGDKEKGTFLKKQWGAVGVISQLRKKAAYIENKGRVLNRPLLENALSFVKPGDPVHRLISGMMDVKPGTTNAPAPTPVSNLENLQSAQQAVLTETARQPITPTEQEAAPLQQAQENLVQTQQNVSPAPMDDLDRELMAAESAVGLNREGMTEEENKRLNGFIRMGPKSQAESNEYSSLLQKARKQPSSSTDEPDLLAQRRQQEVAFSKTLKDEFGEPPGGSGLGNIMPPPGGGQPPSGGSRYPSRPPTGNPNVAVQRAYAQTIRHGDEASGLMKELSQTFGVPIDELVPEISARMQTDPRGTLAKMSPQTVAKLREFPGIIRNRAMGMAQLGRSRYAEDPRYVKALSPFNVTALPMEQAAEIGAAFPGREGNLSPRTLMQAEAMPQEQGFQDLVKTMQEQGVYDQTAFTSGGDFRQRAEAVLQSPQNRAALNRAMRVASNIKSRELLPEGVANIVDFGKAAKAESPGLVKETGASTGQISINIPLDKIEKLNKLYEEQSTITERLSKARETNNKHDERTLEVEKAKVDLNIRKQQGAIYTEGLQQEVSGYRAMITSGEAPAGTVKKLMASEKQLSSLQAEQQAEVADEGVGPFGRTARRLLGGFGMMYARSVFNFATGGLGYGERERAGLEGALSQGAYQSTGMARVAYNQNQVLQNQMALQGTNFNPITGMQSAMAQTPIARDVWNMGVAGVGAWGFSQYAASTMPKGDAWGQRLSAASPFIGIAAAGLSTLADVSSRAKDPYGVGERIGSATGPGGGMPGINDAWAMGWLKMTNKEGFGQATQGSAATLLGRQAFQQGLSINEMQNAKLQDEYGYYAQRGLTTTKGPGGQQYARAGDVLDKTQQFDIVAQQLIRQNPSLSQETAAQTAGFLQSYAPGMALNDKRIAALSADYQSGGRNATYAQQMLGMSGMAPSQMYDTSQGGINRIARVQMQLNAAPMDMSQRALMEAGLQRGGQIAGVEQLAPWITQRGGKEEVAAAAQYWQGIGSLSNQQFGVYQTQAQASLLAQQANLPGVAAPTLSGVQGITDPAKLAMLSSQAQAEAGRAQQRMNFAQGQMQQSYNFGNVGLGNQMYNQMTNVTPGQEWAYNDLFNMDKRMLGFAGTQGMNFNQMPGISQIGGGQISAGYYNQMDVGMNGQLTGLGYGRTSFAQAGGFNAQQMAGNIFGKDWQNNARLSQGGIQAGLKGQDLLAPITINGQTTTQVGGTMGMQLYQDQLQYQQQMADIARQQKGNQLQFAFTTGVGLSQYNGTVDPRTGKSFGNLGATGGFWGLEDQSRRMSNQQQEWSFGFQERQMNLGNQQFMQNMGLQQQGQNMQRAWTRQDWRFNEETRGMQWGWKQEDFQEQARFMTGRERRVAERGMERETIMHDREGEQIDKQKKRQQESWDLEDERFDTQIRQHRESLEMQEEQLKKQREFFAERKKLEEEQVKLQRAYFIQQNALQKEATAAAAHYATENLKLKETFTLLQIASELTGGQLDLIRKDGFEPLKQIFADMGPDIQKIIEAFLGLSGADEDSDLSDFGSTAYNKPTSDKTTVGDFPSNVGTPPSKKKHGGETSEFAAGGFPPLGKVSSVGEQGWEFSVGGEIINHEDSSRLASMGLRPGSASEETTSRIDAYMQRAATEMMGQMMQSTKQNNLLDSISIDYQTPSQQQTSSQPVTIVLQVGNEELKRMTVDIMKEQFR